MVFLCVWVDVGVLDVDFVKVGFDVGICIGKVDVGSFGERV